MIWGSCWFDGFACGRKRRGRIRDHAPHLSPPGLIQTSGKREPDGECATNVRGLVAGGLKQAGGTDGRRTRCRQSPLSRFQHCSQAERSICCTKSPNTSIPQFPFLRFRVRNGPRSFGVSQKRESLRQIARSYHTSHEAVRRVVLAARHELLGREGEPVTLLSEDAEESSKE